jgi:hypothetical protein
MPMHTARAPGPTHLNNLAPRPGKLPGMGGGSDQGGGRGHTGNPTPIIAAGGEIVIPPDRIIARFGDLKHGHKALDKWVIDTRKDHIATLKKLKPPKKD